MGGEISRSDDSERPMFATIEPHIIRMLADSCREGKLLLDKSPLCLANAKMLRDCNFDGPASDIFHQPQDDEAPPVSSLQLPRKTFLEAVAQGELDVVKQELSLDSGLLRRATDKNGNTAAHIAAQNGNLKEFEFFISLEPEMMWAQNEVKNTPAHRAAEAGRVQILRYLKERDPSTLSCKGALGATPIHMAAKNGHLPAIAFLVEDDLSALGHRDRMGSTVLHYAAAHGHLEVVTWVARQRPSLIKDPNNQGDTPAHLAAASGHLEILRSLVSADRDIVFAENIYGRRPSEVAAGNASCRVLLESLECYTVAPGTPRCTSSSPSDGSSVSDPQVAPQNSNSNSPFRGISRLPNV